MNNLNQHHLCHFESNRLVVDDGYEWFDGRWYIWQDKYGRIEKARLKADIPEDRFYPQLQILNRNDIVAFIDVFS